MDVLIREGKLEQAAEMILVIERKLSDAVAISGTRILGVLESRVSLAKAHVKHNVTDALQRLLVISVDDTLAQLSTPVASSEKRPEYDNGVGSLLAALDTLGVKDEVLTAYGARFVRYFIRPVLATPAISLDKSFTCDGAQQFGVKRSSQAN
ncbi:hypothetical protein GGI21_005821, partial [Coemansia aciculifera]